MVKIGIYSFLKLNINEVVENLLHMAWCILDATILTKATHIPTMFCILSGPYDWCEG